MVLVNSRNFTDFHRSSEPLEPLGFVGPFGLTRAGSWEGATSKCASTETSLAASRSTLQQLSIGIGRGAFTQVWSKVERFQVTRVHLKLDVACKVLTSKARQPTLHLPSAHFSGGSHTEGVAMGTVHGDVLGCPWS